jgi:hypothetical protein
VGGRKSSMGVLLGKALEIMEENSLIFDIILYML